MLPRSHRSLTWYVMACLVLAGCASPERPPAEGGPGPVDGSSSSGPVTCTAPPPVPTDVPTFGPEQPPPAVDLGPVTATLQTTCGPVVLELDGAAAPQTVASFVHLAEEGYWRDSPCHRLTTEGIYVLQCGDPTGTGRGGPGYTFGVENAPPTGEYPRGTLAMARSQAPDSNGGQFFIVQRDTVLPTEGGGYTVFGRVKDGLDIIDHVAEQGVDGGGADGIPAQPVSITEVEVKEGAPTS